MAKTVKKTTQASKKKPTIETVQQTHAALPPAPDVNMFKLFGINDGYQDVDNIDQYRAKVENMTITDLHDHAHLVGVVPLEPRDKLIASLDKKYRETKARQIQPRSYQAPINPKMADFHRHFCADSLR